MFGLKLLACGSPSMKCQALIQQLQAELAEQKRSSEEQQRKDDEDMVCMFSGPSSHCGSVLWCIVAMLSGEENASAGEEQSM